MPLTIKNDPVPLHSDENGTVFVGGSSITFREVIEKYLDGQTADQIVEHFGTLRLADVHYVIAYFLQHRARVEAYFLKHEIEMAKAVKQTNKNKP